MGQTVTTPTPDKNQNPPPLRTSSNNRREVATDNQDVVEKVYIVRTETARREVKKRDSATVEIWQEKTVTARRSDGGKGEVGLELSSSGYRKEVNVDGGASKVFEENKNEKKQWRTEDNNITSSNDLDENDEGATLNLSSKKIKTLIPPPEALRRFYAVERKYKYKANRFVAKFLTTSAARSA